MRPTLTRILLAVALAAGALTPAALAGDFGRGPVYANGIEPVMPPTPVPAPIPVPVYEPEWYFRADFAAGFGTQPSVTASGTPFGTGVATRSVGFDPGWLSQDFLPSFTGGVGVGYVWSSAFRTDFTVDIHSIMTSKFNGSVFYYGGGGFREATVRDQTRFMSTILLLNAYYDFRTGTAFTPYVGGGLGFAVNQLTRSDVYTDTAFLGELSASDRTTRVKVAGAAMAGITYDINSCISLDVGYRYLYIGGTDVDLRINGTDTDVTVGGISEQQVRAGFRFYID